MNWCLTIDIRIRRGEKMSKSKKEQKKGNEEQEFNNHMDWFEDTEEMWEYIRRLEDEEEREYWRKKLDGDDQ